MDDPTFKHGDRVTLAADKSVHGTVRSNRSGYIDVAWDDAFVPGWVATHPDYALRLLGALEALADCAE